jgi:hypothetical protein
VASRCRHVRLKARFDSVHGFTQLFGSRFEIIMQRYHIEYRYEYFD